MGCFALGATSTPPWVRKRGKGLSDSLVLLLSSCLDHIFSDGSSSSSSPLLLLQEVGSHIVFVCKTGGAGGLLAQEFHGAKF